MSNPYQVTKKRMLSVQDVPGILEIEGKAILAIPPRIESEIRRSIVHCGQGSYGQSDAGDNVQIRERLGVSKEQMITLAENGMGGNTARYGTGRETLGGKKMASFCRECTGVFDESNNLEGVWIGSNV